MRDPRIVKLALCGLLFLALLLLPPVPGLTPQGQQVLAVVAVAIALWIAEPVPAAITGLVVVLLLALTGGFPLPVALHGFSQPIVYFLFGALTLGLGVAHSGLAERVAGYFISGSRRSPGALYFQTVATFSLMAFLLPSATTRGGVLLPVCDRIFSRLGLKQGEPTPKAMMLGLASLNRLASSALLTGGLVPAMAASLIGGFSWTGWFLMLSVPYYSLLALGSLAVYLLHRPPAGALLPAVPIRQGPRGFSPPELRALAILSLVSLLWLSDFLHGWNPAVPALIGAVLVLLPKLGVMDWPTLEREFPWSNLFIIATSLSLAHALSVSGASSWLAQGLGTGLSPWIDQPLVLLLALMVLTSVIRTGVTTLTGFLPVLIPIAMTFGRDTGFNPVLLGLVVTIVADSATMYLAQSSTAIMAYTRGHFTPRELLILGLAMTPLSYAVITFVALPYWALLGQRLTP